jgi:hypothetical protein
MLDYANKYPDVQEIMKQLQEYQKIRRMMLMDAAKRKQGMQGWGQLSGMSAPPMWMSQLMPGHGFEGGL